MNVKIAKINDMQGVIATVDADVGDIVYEFKGETILYPTRTSVQIGRRHIEEDMIAYVNHSCTPSVTVENMRYNDWNMSGPYALISTGVIVSGDEITFDYNDTEDEIAYPFKCSCHGTLIRGKNHVR